MVMFENLKAFIRHGKQANDFKRQDDVGFDDGIDISNLPSLSEEVQGSARDDSKKAPTESDLRATAIEATKETNDYSQVATKIVEQERRQRERRKSEKYPGLEGYEILEQMGEGAFSVVYRAKQLKTGHYVAVKILRKFQMDQAQKQAVLKEVTILRQLNHPNIVLFVEFIESEPYYYIVQELASGGEIFTTIVNYTYFSEELSRHVIVQVAQALKYLHEEVGIVHRDVKPENLLFTPIEFRPSMNPISKLRKSDDPATKRDEGEFIPGSGGGTIGLVQLADFGLSKQIWEHNTKTPCGTVGYTAPEIVRDEKYSREVDMWALGCVLYTLLCGFPPFYDERIETLTEKVAKGEYTFLAPWWDEISKEAKYCVSRLLTVDPNQRYSITEFLNDPWVLKGASAPALPAKKTAKTTATHPVHAINNRYSKKFSNSGMYSPAAVAMRDAFDISTAVHRMGEEKNYASRMTASAIEDLMEEEEEENEELVDKRGRVLQDKQLHQVPRHHQRKHIPKAANNLFDLDLGGASILERRKQKQVPLQT